MKRDPICEVEQELKTFHSQLSLPIIIAADRRKFAGRGGRDNEIVVGKFHNRCIIGGKLDGK